MPCISFGHPCKPAQAFCQLQPKNCFLKKLFTTLCVSRLCSTASVTQLFNDYISSEQAWHRSSFRHCTQLISQFVVAGCVGCRISGLTVCCMPCISFGHPCKPAQAYCQLQAKNYLLERLFTTLCVHSLQHSAYIPYNTLRTLCEHHFDTALNSFPSSWFLYVLIVAFLY